MSYFFLSISSCASQSIDSKEKDKFAYQLIKYHYSSYSNKKKNVVYIDYKTVDKKSPYFVNRKFGLSNFLRYGKSISPKKCYLDSIFSKNAQQKLDSAYVNFKEVELDPKKIKLKKIKLVYPDTNLDKRKVVSYITFPAIIQDKDIFYAIIVDSDKFEGVIYLYRYEKGKWSLLCDRLLYIS